MSDENNLVCPWCDAKLVSGSKHCPECDNEIIEFETTTDDSSESMPVGGMLIFYVATCLFSILLIMYNYFIAFSYGISNYTWNNYSIFIAAYNFVHLIILISSIFLIFKKKKLIPKIIISFEMLNLVALAISYFLANGLSHNSLVMGAAIKAIWICIWIGYFLLSKRINQTYVL